MSFKARRLLTTVLIVCVLAQMQMAADGYATTRARIVFNSTRDGNGEIYVMDSDGGNQVRLPYDPAKDCDLSWSPDGDRVAYVYSKGGRQVRVMDAEGQNPIQLTKIGKNRHPVWSPDGRKIAFNSLRHFVPADSRRDIFVITADGKELKQLTDGPGSSRSPIYSPDGTKIAYVSGRRGDSNIFLMDANGNNAVKLTKTPPGIGNVNPSWPRGTLAVNPNGKLPISWGELKRTGNPR